jgi:hypothetical protein
MMGWMASMNGITTVGLDLAKNVFQVRLGRALGLPCASDAVRAAEAKASHQVDLAIV